MNLLQDEVQRNKTKEGRKSFYLHFLLGSATIRLKFKSEIRCQRNKYCFFGEKGNRCKSCTNSSP